MSEKPETLDGLAAGHRIPNFVLPSGHDRFLAFYEFANGRPMLLAAAALDWSKDQTEAFARTVHLTARQAGLQSVVILPEPVDATGPDPDAATAHDPKQTILRALLTPHDFNREGVVHVTDPNLRILQGAAIEADALKGTALRDGLSGLVDVCMQNLELERRSLPPAAPVLVVPRVLGAGLCQILIESFVAWHPQASPMPTESGHTAVDRVRKSRLDVFVQGEKLERELARRIARRVLPELRKAFHFEATRMERLKLVCYRAEDTGHFGTHRDNTAPATAHRRFALTVNLNAGAYEGGALEFPEYGADCTYDIPSGTALLFSGTHAHRVQPVTRGQRFALVSFVLGESDRPGKRPMVPKEDQGSLE
ncbi:MAG: 2OG-Fe(II) oxygenase [Myxococcota bacterium]